jgi:hypothetical protein
MSEKAMSRKKGAADASSKSAAKVDHALENRRLRRELAELQRECRYLRRAILKVIPISVPVDDRSLTKMIAQPRVEMGEFLKKVRKNGQ